MCLVDELAARIGVYLVLSKVIARQELPGGDTRLKQLEPYLGNLVPIGPLLRTRTRNRDCLDSKALKPGSRFIVVESEVLCENEGTSKLVSRTTASITAVEGR